MSATGPTGQNITPVADQLTAATRIPFQKAESMSLLSHVVAMPPDPILGLTDAFCRRPAPVQGQPRRGRLPE